MTPANQKGKPIQVSIRFPEDLWEMISFEATKRRSSIQAIVLESVYQYLGIDAPKDAA